MCIHRKLTGVLMGSCLAAALIVPVPVQGQTSQQVLRSSLLDRSDQVLGVPSSFCGHVINLMMTNRLREQTGVRGAGVNGQMMMSHLSVPVSVGDLNIQSVSMVSDGTPDCGPVIQVCVQNNSQIPVGNFQVTVVAVAGRIHVHSPSVTARVDRMESGAVHELQMQLPASSMAMSVGNGQASVFDSLVVAIDSFDELMEADELNNVQILKRSELMAVVTGPAPESASVATPIAPSGAITAPEAAPGPDTAPVGKEPSLLDSIDPEKLSSVEQEAASLFR